MRIACNKSEVMHVGKNGNSLPTVDGANLAMQHEGGAQASRVASFAATAMPTTASAVSASAQGLLRHTQPASSVGVLCSDARARPGRRHTKERARCVFAVTLWGTRLQTALQGFRF